MRPTDYGIGAAVRRKEDPALITGKGCYVGDITPDNCSHAIVVRTSVAHGKYTLEGVEDALESEGVLLVITAKDIEHLGSLPSLMVPKNPDGSAPELPEHPILPKDEVKYVGEAVALVVAETVNQARNAADMIFCNVDEQPVVTMLDQAIDSQDLVWPELGSNVAFENLTGDEEATNTAFTSAEKTVSLELVNNRIVTNYLEPRAAIGSWNTEDERFTLIAPTQGVHMVKNLLAGEVFKVPAEKFHVKTPDVGGAFGTKFFPYQEYSLILEASKRTGRPVKWQGNRIEHFLADYHGRDNYTKAELALTNKGVITGLRVDTLANMGAYVSHFGAFVPMCGVPLLPGCYKIPTLYVRLRGVYTNTVCVDAYRGAGRPEASYTIERLMDLAAMELGLTPDEIRRRNFISPDEMPYKTPTGKTYDSGRFNQLMDLALKEAGKDSFGEREAISRSNGKLRGFGFAHYIEACGGGGAETARIELHEDGKATIYIGHQSGGQGHHTAYAQLLSHHLGLHPDDVTVIQGDSDLIKTGTGTGGSRSIPVGGSSVMLASESLAERIKKQASDILEAGINDLELIAGTVRVAGTDKAIEFAEVVKQLNEAQRIEEHSWQPSEATYPNGTHVVEVEIDPDTGSITIESFQVFDDFGVTLNPILLEGQVHGGVVQGVGQALLERVHYESDTGQLTTASYMDYCMPRADDVPNIHFETHNDPCKTNAIGVKGAGEAGAIGACPAVVNAAIDALYRNFGIKKIDMPLTPEKVWRAIQEAKNRS